MGKYIERTPNFFMDFFVKQRIPEICSKIQFWDHTLNTQKDHNPTHNEKFYSIALIPDYLGLEISNPKTFSSAIGRQNNLGYAIRLSNGFVVDAYLKEQLKKNYRNVKKRHARLETCFNIRYKIFHGDIAQEEYHYLMQCLKAMLVKRFEQRQGAHEKLNEWEDLLAQTKNRIIEKKASLFVIYDNEIPIDISLNYHFKAIMFGAISSYDIDYSKFGLGAIEKIKLLEWCLANDYKLLDFGYGDLDYKLKWSNYVYNFKYQVIFNRKSLVSQLFAKLELFKLRIKEYLKSKKADVYLRKIKAALVTSKSKENVENVTFDCERCDPIDYADLDTVKKIDYELEEHLPLKSVINDFLYATMEHKDYILVQKVPEKPNTFFVSGKENAQRITFRT